MMGGDSVDKMAKRAAKRGGFKRTRRNAARRLAELRTPEAARGLALAAADSRDAAVVELARRTFAEVNDQEVIDAICNVWWSRIATPLHEAIIGNRWIATEPDNLRMLTALHTEQPEALAEGGRDMALLLLSVAGTSAKLGDRARKALAGMVTQEAKDAVYAKALQDDDPVAMEVALADGFTSDPSRRALLLFLSGAFDRLAELDFDGRLLAAAHASADARLRARLAARARESSRVEWVRAITGAAGIGASDRPSDEEWAAARDILSATEQWEQLSQLALQAPPVWSARIIRELGARGWAPSLAADAQGFERLVELAGACADEPAYAAFDSESLLLDDHGCECLAVSPDGRLAAAGSSDGAVRLWHLPSGEPAGVLEDHTGGVTALAFTPDGSLLVSGGLLGRIRVWRMPSGELVSAISGQGVADLTVSPDGTRLVSGGGATAQLWSLPSGEYLAPLKPKEGMVVEVAFGDDGRQIACRSVFRDTALLINGRAPGSIELWGSPAAELEGRHDRPSSMIATPDGKLLISGDQSGWIAIWRLPSGKRVNNLSGHKGPVHCLAVSQDSELLVSGGENGTLRLHRLPLATHAEVLTGHDSDVIELALSADGELLASADDDGVAFVWDVPSGKPVGKLTGHEGGADSLAMSPDGDCLVSGSMYGDDNWETAEDGRRRVGDPVPGTVRLWTAGIARLVHTPLTELRPADIDAVRSLRIRTASELVWLDLAGALAGWRHRHDVEVEDAAVLPGVGDIELDERE